MHRDARGVPLGNLHSYTRLPTRYQGVGKRNFAYSLGFLEEFFSELKSESLHLQTYPP